MNGMSVFGRNAWIGQRINAGNTCAAGARESPECMDDLACEEKGRQYFDRCVPQPGHLAP